VIFGVIAPDFDPLKASYDWEQTFKDFFEYALDLGKSAPRWD
jgi:hypothetical protein